MSNKPQEVTDKEKFQLEFMATDELSYVAQKHKAEIEELSAKMRAYGKFHPEYKTWETEKRLKMRRRYHILSCIKRRQLPLL